MKVFYSNSEFNNWREKLSKDNKSVGLVPTMGALHQGHLNLIEEACKGNDFAVCSIYVNPTQFNNPIDLEKYPRNIKNDLDILSPYSNLVVFNPSDNDIYPSFEHKTPPKVDLGEMATVMEGEGRPGHFEGVLAVINRLFKIVNPKCAYFGLKDFQQYLVVKKLAKTHFSNIKVIGSDIVRSDMGLALSSRNQRLSSLGLKEAQKLNKFLLEMSVVIKSDSIENALNLIKTKIESNARIKLEYLTVANANDLSFRKVEEADDRRVFIAAWIENIRLIDNMKLL